MSGHFLSLEKSLEGHSERSHMWWLTAISYPLGARPVKRWMTARREVALIPHRDEDYFAHIHWRPLTDKAPLRSYGAVVVAGRSSSGASI
jgi:hypothetical protein